MAESLGGAKARGTVIEAQFHARAGAFELTAEVTASSAHITAILGRSGAGKSMFLAALAGLRRIERGIIRIDGRVLCDAASALSVEPEHRGVGLIFQEPRLFPHMSVEQNLRFAEKRAHHRRLNFADAVSRFDLDALVARRVGSLSGGERARAALARALLAGPDLLLLDEPFAALDGARRAAYLATLRALHDDLALPMLIVTHQIDDAAALARDIMLAEDGVISGAASLQDCALTPEFQRVVGAQDLGAAISPASLNIAPGRSGAWVWLRADHVLLANQEPKGVSARNVFRGTIRTVQPEGAFSQLVTIETPIGALRSRVTTEALRDLALAPGYEAWALAKAHGH